LYDAFHSIDVRYRQEVDRALRRRNTRRRKTHQAFNGLRTDEIGYDNAARFAKSAHRHARLRNLKEEAVRLGFVSPAEFDRLL
jgi:fumarate hydratase class II